jgi:hypothetical protein
VKLRGDPAALHLLGLQHAGEDLSAALLADGQRPLGGDAIGHVQEQAADLLDPVDGVTHREHRQQVGAPVDARRLQAHHRLAVREHPTDGRDDLGAHLREGVQQPHAQVLRPDRPDPLHRAVHAHDPQVGAEEHHPQRRRVEHGRQHLDVAVRLVGRDGCDHRDDHPLARELDAVDVELHQPRPFRRLEDPPLAVAAAGLREAVDQPVEPGPVADPELVGRLAQDLAARPPDEGAEPVAHLDHDRVARTRDRDRLSCLGEIARKCRGRRSRSAITPRSRPAL